METESGSFETFDSQYYPTPPSLGKLAFSKFKDKDIGRLLEPQAGRGALADIVKNAGGYGSRGKCDHIDCVELDLANQAILREKGYRVVGTDFLRYKGASVYSHILMNPPFRNGAKHVLHAWDLLFSGEIVAIVNAQDVRNPSNALARQLVTLISNHGSVVFIQQAFMSEDTQRKTEVEIALIRLEKKSSAYADYIDNLKREVEQKFEPARPSRSEVVIPRNFIENMVLNFECAVEAAKQSHSAAARADHFAGRFGRSIAEDGERASKPKYDAQPFNKAYDELKERAWSTVLRSSAVLDKLSSQAQRRIETSFKDICALEFTYDNIWGFLDGLIGQQGQILQDMVCDVFDQFTRYHVDNRTYYQGWKSNSKHRLNAFRLKTTRIVLPAARRDWYHEFSSSLTWDDEQVFRDFDKVFAMLDSKSHENVGGLCALFRGSWKDLHAGARLSSDYFDVRMYAKAGTFHLFPRRKDLIERMNRVVGKARQWLPQEESAAPDAFWQQYERAEQVLAKAPGLHALESKLRRSWSESEKDEAAQQLLEAHQAALETLGIKYDHSMLIKHEQTGVQKLLQIPLIQEDIAA